MTYSLHLLIKEDVSSALKIDHVLLEKSKCYPRDPKLSNSTYVEMLVDIQSLLFYYIEYILYLVFWDFQSGVNPYWSLQFKSILDELHLLEIDFFVDRSKIPLESMVQRVLSIGNSDSIIWSGELFALLFFSRNCFSFSQSRR